MIARVATVSFAGIEGQEVEVQAQLASGLPAFSIVGLADKAVAESRERVRAALTSISVGMPPKRITINLTPADRIKEGSHYDLPIALALLQTMDIISVGDTDDFIALGELSLDGRLLPVAGVLPAALYAVQKGCGLICPETCGSEAAAGGELRVLAADSLTALINHFKGEQLLTDPAPLIYDEPDDHMHDMSHVKGQESAKRALEIAAAGGHNMLMIGPPGAGKSMMASRLPSLLPPLSSKEILEVSMIHSVAGLIKNGKLGTKRPFRAPHHSATLPALVGGGVRARPGEVSLSHKGVLFLDELPEFHRAALESLRQPMEAGEVMIARANAHVTYPADFQLIAAMNPCRCGLFFDDDCDCRKKPHCAMDYQNKISGPLYDRIDLIVTVDEVKPMDLIGKAQDKNEASAIIKNRVKAARTIAQKRFDDKNIPLQCNAQADGKILEDIAPLDSKAQKKLEVAAQQFRLSARGWMRTIKVARTIADLDSKDQISEIHIGEALSFRRRSFAEQSS